jgi:hypothetical protein
MFALLRASGSGGGRKTCDLRDGAEFANTLSQESKAASIGDSLGKGCKKVLELEALAKDLRQPQRILHLRSRARSLLHLGEGVEERPDGLEPFDVGSGEQVSVGDAVPALEDIFAR